MLHVFFPESITVTYTELRAQDRHISFISVRKLYQDFYFAVVLTQRVTKEPVIISLQVCCLKLPVILVCNIFELK